LNTSIYKPIEVYKWQEKQNTSFMIDVAKVLDIHPIMLYRWKKEYRDGSIMKNKTKES